MREIDSRCTSEAGRFTRDGIEVVRVFTVEPPQRPATFGLSHLPVPRRGDPHEALPDVTADDPAPMVVWRRKRWWWPFGAWVPILVGVKVIYRTPPAVNGSGLRLAH